MRRQKIPLPEVIAAIQDRAIPAGRRVAAIASMWMTRYHVPDDEWQRLVEPALLSCARDEAEPTPVRVASLQALRNGDICGDPAQAMDALLACLRSRSQPVRENAVIILAKVDAPEVRILLRSLLADKSLAKKARAALVALLQPPVDDLPHFRPPKSLAGSNSTFMKRAIQLAVENVTSKRGGPFGAVLAYKGKVVAEGTNLVTACNDPSAHAEIMAIRAACQFLNRLHLDDCTLYSSCEPCPMCLGAIHLARVGQLYFAATRDDAAAAGFDDSFIYDQMPLNPARRSIPATRMLAREGRAPLAAWLNDAGRIEY